jgi:hypothetical protein
MNARTNGIRCQSARASDLFIAKTRHFPHEEYVTVEISQYGEGLIDSKVDILRWRSRRFVRQLRRGGPPQMLAVVINRQVPGNSEQPSPDLAVRRSRDRCPTHPHEDVLGEVTCRLCFADRSAEVLEQVTLVGGEERSGVVGHASLLLRTWCTADPRNDRKARLVPGSAAMVGVCVICQGPAEIEQIHRGYGRGR